MPSGQTGPGPRVPRPLWSFRAVGAVVGAITLVLLLVFGAQLLDRSSFESTTLAGPVTRVDIRLARGNVDLVPAVAESADVVVERTSRWRFSQPSLTAEVLPDSGVARIDATCPRVVLVVGICRVDYLVQVPAGLRVDVRTDSGTVTFEGLDGWVRVVTSDGAVAGTNLSTQEVLVDSQGGAVSLGFSGSPSRILVLSGGGSIDIQTPGGPFQVRASGGKGERTIDVPVEPDAERTITLDSGNGDVTVTSR
ncbi:MAG: hypothetical protein JJE52_16575 [Acidimicrobiia bacterium]|nr:hypothetical protein [Acidimicrobiia bacterium]